MISRTFCALWPFAVAGKMTEPAMASANPIDAIQQLVARANGLGSGWRAKGRPAVLNAVSSR